MVDDKLLIQLKAELKTWNNSWVNDVQKKCGMSHLTIRETLNPRSKRFSKKAFQSSLQVLKEYRNEERRAADEAKKILEKEN